MENRLSDEQSREIRKALKQTQKLYDSTLKKSLLLDIMILPVAVIFFYGALVTILLIIAGLWKSSLEILVFAAVIAWGSGYFISTFFDDFGKWIGHKIHEKYRKCSEKMIAGR